jgi:AAA family ATP:ADP antiporter
VFSLPCTGAEVIPFLKTYVNLPAALLITVVYSKLCNAMPMSKVFYTLITPFLMFFASFAFFIYPNRGLLHPNQAADYLSTILPASFNGPISIFRNWTYALFYTMAELWGSVVVSLLFWGFANEVRRPATSPLCTLRMQGAAQLPVSIQDPAVWPMDFQGGRNLSPLHGVY